VFLQCLFNRGNRIQVTGITQTTLKSDRVILLVKQMHISRCELQTDRLTFQSTDCTLRSDCQCTEIVSPDTLQTRPHRDNALHLTHRA
jgi:hypothetical protein